MKKIDLTKPFKLTIEGELMAEDGKKYAAGVYPANVGLPDKMRLAHYGETVDTEQKPRQAAIFSKPTPTPTPLAVVPDL